MKKTEKKRLCWNCEGNVTVDAELCPYCGVSVVPASLENVNANIGFKPSYNMAGSHDSSIPSSPYDVGKENEVIDQEQETSRIEEHEPALDEFQNTLIATVLLLSGSVFFLFSLVLMLFARNGVLVLQWDGSLWYIYGLIALPLLFIGWRYLSRLDRER